MKLLTLDKIDFKDKKVFLRTDLNSDVKEGTKTILSSERIKEASSTIKELIKKKAKVVIIAHQGNKGKEDFLDLSQHAKMLSKYVKVKFIKDIIGNNAINSIKNLKSGEAILLDNIRFLDEETEPEKFLENNRIEKILVPMFDIYINDAFSVCHRPHSSIIIPPKKLKSGVGRIVEKELTSLEKINIKNCLYILGGAKPEENIKLLNGKKVLACGLFGQLCYVAIGKNLGFQNEYLKKATLIKGDYSVFLKKLYDKLNNVFTPTDFAVNKDGKRIEFDIEKFPMNYEIMDIGEKTIKKYVEIIKKAPAIYMKGPAGDTTDKQYMKGTEAILNAVSKCEGFTLIGGGHLSDVIENLKIDKKKFGHISLSGGALLSYVAGEKLPGLEALGYY